MRTLLRALERAGLLRLRQRADYRPTYRLWGSPIIPIVFIAASLVIVVMQVLANPKDSARAVRATAKGRMVKILLETISSLI